MTADAIMTQFPSGTDATGEDAVTEYKTYEQPDHCTKPRWCEEANGHDTPHRKYLLHQKTDAHGMDLDTGRLALVGLVRQGDIGANTPVLILDDKQVALPWKLAVRMARAILAESENLVEGEGILENI